MSEFAVTNLVDYSACSTVIIHAFGEESPWSTSDFPLSELDYLQGILDSIRDYEEDNTCGCSDDCCPRCDLDDYSWVMMSVLTDEQPDYLQYLKNLELLTTGPSWNGKNSTEVTWFFWKANGFKEKVGKRIKELSKEK